LWIAVTLRAARSALGALDQAHQLLLPPEDRTCALDEVADEPGFLLGAPDKGAEGEWDVADQDEDDPWVWCQARRRHRGHAEGSPRGDDSQLLGVCPDHDRRGHRRRSVVRQGPEAPECLVGGCAHRDPLAQEVVHADALVPGEGVMGRHGSETSLHEEALDVQADNLDRQPDDGEVRDPVGEPG